MKEQNKFKELKEKGLSIKFLSNLTGIKESLLYKWNSQNQKISEEKEEIINNTINDLYVILNKTKKIEATSRYKNIKNQKFNHLTALYPVGANTHGDMQWACQCDCGNPILKIATYSCLKNNEVISCGCQRTFNGGKNLKNFIGKKFGKLTVIKRANNDNSGRVQWLCQCDCGNLTIVRGKDLSQKKVSSCGCIKQSIGELNIENLLKNNNIIYEKEYKFSNLLSPKGYPLRFDFAIFSKNKELHHLIEFDGKQHNDSLLHFNETKQDQNYRKICDNIKDNYCKINNIPLIRIPYEKRDSIKLEELLC